MTVLLFIIGLILLVKGADILVEGASGLAGSIGVSPLVVGLTVVAFGTSSPELAVCVQSALNGQPNIALGNVVGSNIANILLILGIAAAVNPLVVQLKLIRFDVPLMIGISFLVWFLAWDGTINSLDGLLLFAGIVAYVIWSIHESRQQGRTQAAQQAVELEILEATSSPRSWILNLTYVIGGLIMLVIGSDWLVDGATALARFLGISELLIGLTIIAVGTSLPEIATSIAAGMRGKADLAAGNAIGSNIFNILLVLGLTAMVAPIRVPIEAFSTDIPVMIGVALLCVPILLKDFLISRSEGILLLTYYVIYLLYLGLSAAESSFLPIYKIIIIPAVILTSIILVVRSFLFLQSARQSPT